MSASVTHLDMSPRDVRQYSLGRLIRALSERRPSLAPFEFECSRALASKLDLRDTLGAYVPMEAVRAPPMDTTTTGEGAELVGDGVNEGFTPGLYRNMSLTQMGAATLEGLVANTAVPSLDAIVTEWLGEGADATERVAATASPTATAHTVAARVPCTRRLVKQTNPSVDQMLTASMQQALGASLDATFIDGSGDQPTGLRGAGAQTFPVSGIPKWGGELAEMVGHVAKGNGFQGGAPTGWVLGSKAFTDVISTAAEVGGGALIYDHMAKFGPVTSMNSAEMSATSYAFGRMSDCLVCLFGVLDVSVKNLNASDTYTVHAFLDCDLLFRRLNTFAISV